jgi:penicillin amidase
MSTLSVSTPTGRRSRVLPILLKLFLAVALIIVCAVGYAWFVAESALPQIDGKQQIAGLSAAVTVTRDRQGVPTIDAATPEDLFFTQGYVTAQDRLWQMDVMRRFASGELSEILGEDTVKLDREQRILGMRAVAQKSFAAASPRDRRFLEAYARGVNAFIESRRSRLPIEFRILRYAPKPWLTEDSLVVGAQMVKDLNYSQSNSALAREKILARLGPELTDELYVNHSWHDRPPTVMREDLDEPNSNSGDSDDDDDDDSGPDNSVTQNAFPAAVPNSMPSSALSGQRFERLGRFRSAHRHGKTSPLRRYAPRPSDAKPVVRGASARRQH